MSLEGYLNARWYARPGLLYLLWPLEWLFRTLAGLRRRSIRPQSCGAPVVVVGNIAVGGSGKTPAVVAIAQHLARRGWRPGIVSRGYGGKADHYPLLVNTTTPPSQAGDEPCLIARRTGLPVAVAPDRVAAAKLLVEQGCNVIISDDGLQHYRLARDVEVLLLDATRGLGNGHCLPVGPLREAPTRSDQVDLIISNGGEPPPLPSSKPSFVMRLFGQTLVNLHSGERRDAAAWPEDQRRVKAIAGIGHPPRFFAALTALGFDCETQAFPDHHEYHAEELSSSASQPLIMTEKDAVKCAAISPADSWMLPVDGVLPDAFYQALDHLLGDAK